jgi:membrane-associated protease RseP (regulator of RpoE activity)
MLALFLSRVFSHPHEVASTMGGPVMITQQFHAEYAKAAATKHTLETVFFLPGALSIGVGLTNAIPLMPFDGGHIVRVYLEKVHKRASEIYAVTGFALFAILMIASIGGDINLMVNWVVGLFR